MAKKALLFLVTTFSLLFFAAKNTSAQETPAWGPSYDEAQMNAYRDAIELDNCATPSLECLVHQTSRFVAIEWVNDILYPERPFKPNSGVAAGNGTQVVRSRGFIGGMAYLMGEMYRYPAARTSVYVDDLLENAHIITPAYAQGLGFASLNPVLELWKVFRNVAYMLFVLIFIILGFMIMFRQKISGQSAVTAQQAIPSVITSLIFVTFSYAIAGFLIDMMYLLMFMIIGVFGQTGPGLDGGIIDFNILDLMGRLFKDVSGFDSNVDIVSNLFSSLVESQALGNVLGVIGGLTLSLVLAVAILIGTFKLFFELLKSYASVILSVVTAPIVLLAGAFPGNNKFGPWIKNLIANLSAFPTVLMVIILFYQFTSKTTGADTTGGFIPPFLLGRGQAGAITTLMGLAIILALPEIVKDVKKKLGATEGFGSMIASAAGARAKEGVPLGGRVSMGAFGGAAGGALGTLGGGVEGFYRGAQKAGTLAARGQIGKAGRVLVRNTVGGAFMGNERIKKDKDGNVMRDESGKPITYNVGGLFRGARRGVGLGIRTTSEVASKSGIRQPDYLNPITGAIDKLDPKTSEKEKSRQEWEDRFDALRRQGRGG